MLEKMKALLSSLVIIPIVAIEYERLVANAINDAGLPATYFVLLIAAFGGYFVLYAFKQITTK